MGDAASTCARLTSADSWVLASSLRTRRHLHCAWRSARGLVLLGGEASRNTSELLTEDGGSVEHFPLKYDTRWVDLDPKLQVKFTNIFLVMHAQ